jgi:hypothetical protein
LVSNFSFSSRCHWKAGIRLVGDAERIGLETKPQQASVAVERVLRVEDGEALEIGRCQRDLAEPLGLHTHSTAIRLGG